MTDPAMDHLDATARAYLDGYQNGYQDGYDHGKADAIAAMPDPGPMDEDQARVQIVPPIRHRPRPRDDEPDPW